MHVDHSAAVPAFLDELDLFAATVSSLSDADLVAASLCRGWTVGDVIVHVHMGLQEMLLGLVSLVDAPPDADASSYWRGSLPSDDDEADRLDNVRFVRLLGAAYRRPSGLMRHLLPTASGVRSAVRALPEGTLSFQGHVLSTGDFLTTWAVELAIHQLDLSRELPVAPPTPASLALTRATVEALAGRPMPSSWDDRTVALLGAGRVDPGPDQAAVLPVLG
jgi:uncharacterized protein (TIGR03083 family)